MSHQTKIDAPMSRLLSWIATGWIPAPKPTGELSLAKFGDDDISSEIRSSFFGPDKLTIKCEGLRGLQSFSETSLKQFAGTTTEGWQILADSAYISSSNFSTSSSTPATYVISSHRATLRMIDCSPQFWFGRVSLPIRSIGNLTIAIRRGDSVATSYNNLLLNGVHKYYFVNSDYLYLLIQPSDPEIALDDAILELDLLKFSLGTNFILSSISGLDLEGNVVEYHIGSTIGISNAIPQIPPVPLDDPQKTWIAPFFGALSKHSQSDDKNLRFSISYYLQSSEGNLDSKYLDLHMAVNLLAKYILSLKFSEGLHQVKNIQAWYEWVAKEEESIHTLARAGSEQELIESVRAAGKPPTSSIIRNALKILEIDLSDFSGELDVWNNIEEHGSMTQEEPRNFREDLRRIALLGTLCALLSKTIGYNGPIMGPPKDLLRMRPTVYWPSGEQADGELMGQARHSYIAQSDFAYPPAGILWPDFICPNNHAQVC